MEKFRSFPSRSHVLDVCKMGQGDQACRYLKLGENGPRCKRYGVEREEIDKRCKEGKMGNKARGCSGLIGILVKNKEEVIGSRVEYNGIEGLLDNLQYCSGTGKASISAGVIGFSVQEGEAQIDISDDSIHFLKRGSGLPGLTIFTK